MKRQLTALALSLLIAAPASAVSAQDGLIQFRYMGDMTCGGWRAAPSNVREVDKSVLVNFILGFIVGRTALRGDDLLADVEITGVAAWLDDYCSNNPLASLITAAFELEKALIARRQP